MLSLLLPDQERRRLVTREGTYKGDVVMKLRDFFTAFLTVFLILAGGIALVAPLGALFYMSVEVSGWYAIPCFIWLCGMIAALLTFTD